MDPEVVAWLLKESELTQAEWDAYVALGTHTKVLKAIKKSMGLSDQAIKDKVAAENARLDFEKRYTDEYLPEMRKVTSDAVKARADAAAARARAEEIAKTAKDYGLDIAPEPAGGGNGAGGNNDPQPRAPGSPDPSLDDRFNNFSRANSHAIITLNDISAEHFELFGAPLKNSQGLVDEVERQRSLGHKTFTLKQAWEQAYKVADKRTEIATAARKKETDTAVEAALKAERQKHSAHPGLRTGQPSRFANYNPTEGDNAKKPWQVPAGQRRAAMQPWRDKAVAKIMEHVA